jgi:hypothetical protein
LGSVAGSRRNSSVSLETVLCVSFFIVEADTLPIRGNLESSAQRIAVRMEKNYLLRLGCKLL